MGKNASGSDNRHDAEILRQAAAFKAAKAAEDAEAAELAAQAIRDEIAQANKEHGG